ncbi:MAG: deoxynucleoside kinase [Anaerolineales bacterium]|jgi:deoxyadenosine/deoxycytidine kinase
MGFLVSIIGNSGVGKTTLAEKLAEQSGFFAGKEELPNRPFQSAFARDLHRYALANQVDFLLYRAEQERQIRSMEGIGVQDGGMDLDIHLFTHLFHHKGYLSDGEYSLCHRLYDQLRQALPGPDLFIYLESPIEVITQRFGVRNRRQEITRGEDLEQLQGFLQQWLDELAPDRVMTIDAAVDIDLSSANIDRLAQSIIELLGSQDQG